MASTSSTEFHIKDIPSHNARFYDDDLSNSPPKTIRLLCVQPGKFDDPLICKLETLLELLENHQQAYHTLSYSWNDESGWRTLALGNKFDFRIGKSLFSALRRLRRIDEPRWVWCDQVCINQASIAEKNIQVSLMGEIYSQAEVVCLWLGPCGNTNREEDEKEAEVCRSHIIHEDATFEFVTHGLRVVQLCDVHVKDKTQWWWRMWIVQEALHPIISRNFHGSKSLS